MDDARNQGIDQFGKGGVGKNCLTGLKSGAGFFFSKKKN